ncbi:MAG: hypothetical protein KBD63_01295 [Bacteriovoracaceae bacterium]|nr:hypothetical protein [Bacteriovoracaceae bacterium]
MKNNKKYLFLFWLSFFALAQEQKVKEKKVIYTNKSIDFDDLLVEENMPSPMDTTADFRSSKKFENKRPFRKNFNPEINKNIESIR